VNYERFEVLTEWEGAGVFIRVKKIMECDLLKETSLGDLAFLVDATMILTFLTLVLGGYCLILTVFKEFEAEKELHLTPKLIILLTMVQTIFVTQIQLAGIEHKKYCFPPLLLT
jgi:membrane-associated HD superfamily phosphohydrolase